VVQEIFGVNAHIRAVAERLAGFGYHVLAPALFDRVERDVELGYDGAGIARGKALRDQITEAQALQDIETTASAFGAKPVGIIGYCWGGTLAWLAATKTDKFWAASGWYGSGIAAQKDLIPSAPVQLHFGEADSGIPLSDVEAIRTAQPGIDIFTYEGAQHGFGCEARASYSRKDWELAELRALTLFAAHLR